MHVWAILVKQEVYLVMLTAETYIGFDFPDISSTFANFYPRFEMGRISLGKNSKQKIKHWYQIYVFT